MISMPTRQIPKEQDRVLTRNELADSHCHLDIFTDLSAVRESIGRGVLTIITDGVDMRSNARALEIADNVNIFPALGVDPEHVPGMQDRELDFNVDMIRQNSRRIVAIGEIGLDFMLAKSEKERDMQRVVFGRMLDLANELDLPVSVHARDSMDAVIPILRRKRVKRVHLHFFSGSGSHVDEVVKLGYMISIPPVPSAARRVAIERVPLQQIMAETDCPIVGKTPYDVERSVRIIAETKGIKYEEACKAIVENTKRFFAIEGKVNKRKSPLIRQ